MISNYDALRQKYLVKLDANPQKYVNVSEFYPVTLFREYNAVDLYLSGNDMPEHLRKVLYSTREGSYWMHDIGNHGFKRSYLKLYTAYRQHPKYGMYVGWMVHI